MGIVSKGLWSGLLLSALLPLGVWAETYRVAINPNSPPKAFQDEKGLPIGIDIDLMQAIAKAQNFEVEFRNVEKKLPAISEGQADIAPSIVITKKRQEEYGMSNTYMTGYTTALYKTPGILNDPSIENLGHLRIAVVFDTNKHKLLEENNIPVLKAESIFLGIKMVFKGEADAFVTDDSILKYTLLQRPELKAELVDLTVNGELEKSEYGFAVHKDKQELLSKINEGLEKIKASGEYDSILKKWLGEGK